MEHTLPSIIKKALGGVVSISALSPIDSVKKKHPQILFPVFENDHAKRNKTLKKILGANLNISGGSGFVVDTSGIVVTNMHVITHDHLEYQITTADEEVYPATLVGTDIIADIAFLKITSEKKKRFTTLKLGNSSKVALGEHVLAIGNALGMFKNTVSFGIVSGLSRNIEAGNEAMRENLRGLIQTDAAINPGNSGGPLINMKGEVVGINAASVFEAENIGFAIPVNTIKRDLESLKKYGEITRPFLGVRYLIIDDHTKDALGLSCNAGVVVTSPHSHQEAVIKESPAHKAGIREGDVITALDGKPLTVAFTLQDFLDTSKIGQKITITLLRGTKERIVSATLEKRP